MITQGQMMAELEKFIARKGGVYKAAADIGITPPYLYDVLKGARRISDRIASHIGFHRREVVYFESLDAADLADKVL